MEQIQDPLKLYQEILKEFLVKTNKVLDKKQKTQLQQLFDQHKNEIFQEKSKIGLSANKHYILFYKLMQLKNVKVTSECLYHIEKLVQHKFLTGNCPDYITNSGENTQQKQQQNSNNNNDNQIQNSENRFLYNCIIENICEQVDLKDDGINIKVIQCLLHLMTCSSCEIHGNAVNQVINTIIGIYQINQNKIIDSLSKNAVLQIIHVMFMRMEQVTILSDEERKIFSNKKSNPNHWVGGGGAAGPSSQTPTSGQQSPQILNTEENFSNQQQSQNQQIQIKQNSSNNQQDTSRLLYNYYVKKVVGSCIDDVCLYDAKRETILKQAEQNFQDNETQKHEFVQRELALLPIRSAPLLEDSDKIQYKNIKQVEIQNELGIISGKFGWCFICRNTAKNYCKDTRVPICSEQCKIKHLEELGRLQKISEDTSSYLSDCIRIFQHLCKLSLPQQKQQLTIFQLKQKTLILEILLSIMEGAGAVFLSKKEFVTMIKQSLIQSLLQNSLSQVKSVFVISFSLIVELIKNFRENLKSEVGVFVQDIFLKLLDSNNSDFNHRLFTLQVFHRIFRVPRAILELYVNYDCSMEDIGIVENIITMLTRIGQGKYNRQEYSTLILPPQQIKLKQFAIESLKELVKRLCDFLDQCEAINSTNLDEQQLEDLESNQNLNNNSNDTNLGQTRGYSETIQTEGAEASMLIDNNFDRVEREKLKKQQIMKGIQKFNLKSKNGINYLLQCKIIDKANPKSLAQIFFEFNSFISQEMLGQYLGNVDEFNQLVLSEFTDLMDFRNIHVDIALRIFLTYYQLPGEAQQVDRIMQKFGEKYMSDNMNSTYLKSGNVAYVLSYSLMMLTTSLHNPQVQEKERMTCQQFIALIKGINEEDGDKEDIDEKEIERMFAEIKKEPLAKHKQQIDIDKKNQALNTNEKQKRDLFLKETDSIMQQGQVKINKSQNKGTYTQVFSLDYLKSLMQEIWSPLFASFTQVFEESDNKALLDACLDGMVFCIKLLGISNMQTEKDTFLFFLIKNSGLCIEGHEITEKNILCTQHILKCALQAGNYLHESWKQILKCISQLDSYQIIASRKNDSLQAVGNQVRKPKNLKDQLIEQQNSEIIMQNIENGQIDKIFHLSHNLSPENVKIFIQCLCDLSSEELKIEDNPRIFSMQRISEVTGFNMQRVKYNWKEIWKHLSKFFQDAGTHINPQIAELAVDFLKQLGLKFLEQKELKHFTFQKDFLSPFEYIYVNMKINNVQLKELIVACIYMLTNQSFYNLKSGWKIILRIVNLAIQDNQPNLNQICFMIIQKIMNEKLEVILDVIVELVQALTALAKGNNDQYANVCISHIKTCLDFLIHNSQPNQQNEEQQQQIQLTVNQQQQQKYILQECQKHLDSLWIPIMSTLALLFEREVKGVQRTSVDTLFSILYENGHVFSQEFWKQAIRSVLKPLFDEIQYCFSKKNFSNEDHYIITKNSSAVAFEKLQLLCKVFFEKLRPFWQEISDIFMNSIKNQTESLVNLSTTWLVKMLEAVGSQLNNEEWEIIIKLIEKIHFNQIFDTDGLVKVNPDLSKPFEEIMHEIPQKPKINLNLNIQKTMRLTITQLMITRTQSKIFELFGQYFNDQQLNIWKEMCKISYENAQYFNSHLYLRYSLWKNGLTSDLKVVPAIFQHETESFAVFIQITYEQYKRNPQSRTSIKNLLAVIIKYMSRFQRLIQEFMQKSYILSEQQVGKDGQKHTQHNNNNNNVRRRKSISIDDTNEGQKNDQNQKQNTQKSGLIQKSTKSSGNLFNQQDNHTAEDLQQIFLIDYERVIEKMRANMHTYILPYLKFIAPEELDSEDFQKIVQILIEISSYSFTRSLSCLTCTHCRGCNTCSYYTSYQYDGLLKEVLNTYFTYSFSNMQQISKKSSYEMVDNSNNNNNAEISQNLNNNNKDIEKNIEKNDYQQQEKKEEVEEEEQQQIEENELKQEHSNNNSEQQQQVEEDNNQKQQEEEMEQQQQNIEEQDQENNNEIEDNEEQKDEQN